MKRLMIALSAIVVMGAAPPPRMMTVRVKPQCDSAGRVMPSNHIIVQGGIAPNPTMTGGVATPASGQGMLAVAPNAPVGPQPDDPAALGPKQDDPGPPPSSDLHASVAGGAVNAAGGQGMLAAAPQDAPVGPKPGDPAALGPKQDDPGPPPSPDIQASVAGCKVRPGG